MRTIKNFLPLWLLPVLLVGCSTTISNVTPNQHLRNPAGLYPVETAWQSDQTSLRKDTLKAYVLVGMDSYPMQRTPLVSNRWETLVPVPADKNVINYRFKYEYEYLSIPHRRKNSKLSPPYQLIIIDQ